MSSFYLYTSAVPGLFKPGAGVVDATWDWPAIGVTCPPF